MRFDWDKAKRLRNLREHGVDFVGLETLFESETYTVIDDRFDYGEVRLLTLGLLNGEVLAISHTESDEVIRIISVRKAQRHEQETYFKTVRD
jgi:uncharacterized protein